MELLDALKRRSRVKRQASDRRIALTQRDIEIFLLLYRHRYLRSTHFPALLDGKSKRRFIERLGHLYHEGGYIERPPQQWQAINARYMPAVYELGELGERVLRERGLLDGESPLLHRGRGNGFYFHHELMVCDIIASIEIGIRQNSSVRFISWQEILAKAPEATRRSGSPFAIPVSISHTFSGKRHSAGTPLIPDALFGIEYLVDDKKSYRFFALEADRANEPLTRTNLTQTSYLRKIIQYRAIATNRIYQPHWGVPNLFVLTVTTSEQRTKSIIELVEHLTNGNGSTHFLFKTMPSLASLEKAPLPTPFMLAAPWQRAGHPEFRIDQP